MVPSAEAELHAHNHRDKERLNMITKQGCEYFPHPQQGILLLIPFFFSLKVSKKEKGC